MSAPTPTTTYTGHLDIVMYIGNHPFTESSKCMNALFSRCSKSLDMIQITKQNNNPTHGKDEHEGFLAFVAHICRLYKSYRISLSESKVYLSFTTRCLTFILNQSTTLGFKYKLSVTVDHSECIQQKNFPGYLLLLI